MNGKLIVVLSIMIIAPTLFSQQALQDVVYLKNGSIIRGIIVEQIHNVSITIQTRDGNIFKFKMDEVLKIVKEPAKKEVPKTTLVKQKSPLASFLLSFFVPGIGQYYNGQILKGLAMQTGFVVGILYLGRDSDSKSSANSNNSELFGSFLMMGCWAISIIDAPMSSNRINETKQQTYGHFLEFKQGDNLIGFDFSCMEGIVTPRISYHF